MIYIPYLFVIYIKFIVYIRYICINYSYCLNTLSILTVGVQCLLFLLRNSLNGFQSVGIPLTPKL